ncbi:MAG: ribosome biogenesis GTP-binding protein YihA/YsxC [Owenweeksia sp.]|nr:ribosome biogenesis GTP-binding protein YihA/YsxC [Owenweeksia sp.]
MSIKSAEFLCSNTEVIKCPEPNKPEYAFIGRSNVGKSSLINKLVNRKGLAKTSGRPGKTQLINHFLINENWYLTDLPGYGYAKASKTARRKFQQLIEDYILERPNLVNLFVLIDTRHEPQKIDLEFMEWLGENEIPFSMVFTKTDKLKGGNKLNKNIKSYSQKMLERWEEVPLFFTTSAETGEGVEQLGSYIEQLNQKMGEQLG